MQGARRLSPPVEGGWNRTAIPFRTMALPGRGFTLIELLVVVSIISLLVSVLLPSLSNARHQAKGTVCLANLRRLATATVLYMHDNGGTFPPFKLDKANPSDTAFYRNRWGRVKPRWQWFLHDEVQPVIDPYKHGAVPPNGSPAFDAAMEMDKDYFLDPELTGPYERSERNGAYGFNYQYLGNPRIVNNRHCNWPVKESRVTTAAETVLLADSRGGGVPHGKHSYTLDPPRLAHEKNAVAFGPETNDGISFSPVEMRHLGKGNVCFVDGHAESRTYRELGYATDEKGVAVPTQGEAVVGASNRFWNGTRRDPFGQMGLP